MSKDQVKLKKCFYVLQPLLAIRHIERGLGMPPARFQALADAVAPDEIKPAIAALSTLQHETPEIGTGDAIPEITRSCARRSSGTTVR